MNWPTTPIQRWFFANEFFTPNRWNVTMLYSVTIKVDLEILKISTQQLFNRHEALRLQFRQLQGKWVQYFSKADEEDTFNYFDLSQRDDDRQTQEFHDITTKLHQSFTFGLGRLVRFAYFDLGKKGARFLIIAHHLICDGVSLGVLINDLSFVYRSLAAGSPPLPPRYKSSRFVDWALRVHSRTAMELALAERSFWAPKKDGFIPVDFPEGESTVGTMQLEHMEFGSAESKALIKLAQQQFYSNIDIVLIWATAASAMEWLGDNSIVLCIAGHGRETIWPDLQLSHAIGYFNVHYPLFLDFESSDDATKNIRTVSRQLELVPNHGIGYGILQYIYNQDIDTSAIQLQADPELGFNYLGNFDAMFNSNELFSVTRDRAAWGQDPQSRLPYKLSMFAYILHSKIHLYWMFSTNVYLPETIQRLMSAVVVRLRSLLA